jgi:hypothetical protein
VLSRNQNFRPKLKIQNDFLHVHFDMQDLSHAHGSGLCAVQVSDGVCHLHNNESELVLLMGLDDFVHMVLSWDSSAQ